MSKSTFGQRELKTCVLLREAGGSLTVEELCDALAMRASRRTTFVNRTLPRMERKGLVRLGHGRVAERPEGVAVAEMMGAVIRVDAPCEWGPLDEASDDIEVCTACGALRNNEGLSEVRAECLDGEWAYDECPLRVESHHG